MKRNSTEQYFHEDSYKMIELVSNKNYFSLTKELDNFRNINTSEDYFVNGFKSIYKVPKTTVKLDTQKIVLSEIEEILDSLSKNKTSNIRKGYSNSYSLIENSKGWGFEYSVIIVEYSKQYVENLWILETGEGVIIENDRGERLKKALNSLGRKFNLVLVDWNKEMLVNISKENYLIHYLREKLNYNL